MEALKSLAVPPVPVGKPPVTPTPMLRMNKPVVCYTCRQPGHKSPDCPYRASRTNIRDNVDLVEGGVLSTPNVERRPEKLKTPDPPSGSVVHMVGRTLYVEAFLNGCRRRCLLDSGSECSLLPRRLAVGQHLKLSVKKLQAANGTRINVLGLWETELVIGQLRLPVEFLVLDQIDEILFGVDFPKI